MSNGFSHGTIFGLSRRATPNLAGLFLTFSSGGLPFHSGAPIRSTGEVRAEHSQASPPDPAAIAIFAVGGRASLRFSRGLARRTIGTRSHGFLDSKALAAGTSHALFSSTLTSRSSFCGSRAREYLVDEDHAIAHDNARKGNDAEDRDKAERVNEQRRKRRGQSTTGQTKFNHVSIIKGVPPISSPVRNRPPSQHP